MSDQFFGAKTKPPASTAISFAGKIMGSTAFAQASGGEMTFTQFLPAADGMTRDINLPPLKYLFTGVGRVFKGFTGVFKDKRRMIPVAVMSVVWLLLLFLPILGIKGPVLGYLNFLTFSHGGTSSGVIGMIGGVFGKGLFTYFIFALVLPLGGKPFAGVGGGLKRLFGSLAIKNMKALAYTLAGIGAALVACNILTGDLSIRNSMAGIVAFILSLRALSNKAGFLRGFVASMANKFSKGKTPDASLVNRVIAGWAAGFAIAAALSLTGISIICYLAGALLIIVAIVLAKVSGQRKEAAA